jgi:hypothetical protein
VLDNVGPQVVANGVGIPAHAGEKVLDPIRRAVTGCLGQLPAVLASHRSEQALEVGGRSPARLDPQKTRRNPFRQLVKPARPAPRIIHRRHGPPSMTPMIA